MAWAGTGLVWTMSGGIPVSRAFAKSGKRSDKDAGKGADFSFVQISDSHIGFNKPANPDVTATLQTAINKINAMPHKPDFIIHTGDLSQLSKPSEFDTLDQVLKGASAKQIYFVPGEHDMLSDNGEQFLQRYGKGTKGTGWSSFDHKGVHFVGLVNVANLKAGGMGSLGHEQLGVARGRSQGPLGQHSDCAVRTHSAVDHLSRLGLGNRRQRTSLVLRQAFRFRDCAKRSHSPDHAEGRR
jgi:3',5'-cyclic-AMP phosphodiesterase